MKYIYRSLFVYFAMIGAVALANLAPLPVTINAQSSSAPSVEVYRANARTLQFTVQDGVGSSATNLSLVGMTVRGYWFQSLRSTNVIQGTTSLIDGGSNGVVNIAFAAADLNHADGKYLYGLTIENGSGQIVTVNQGKFEIRPSPPVTGVSTTSFGQVINWNTYTSYTGNANAPVQPGSNITATTNSAGVVTFSTHATGETNIITSIVEGTAIDITTNGLGRTVSVDGTESFNASGATNLNGTSIASGTVADARIASSIARDSELTQVLAGTAIGVVTSGVNRTVSLIATGDWTGTFDGQEGTWYLGRANHTGTQLASTISDFQTTVSNNVLVATAIQPDDMAVLSGLLLTNSASTSSLDMHDNTPAVRSLLVNAGGGFDFHATTTDAANRIARFKSDGIILDKATSITGQVDIVGNVGIGTASPSNSLHVVGEVVWQDGSAPRYLLRETDAGNNNFDLGVSGGQFLIREMNDAGVAIANRFTIDGNGVTVLNAASTDSDTVINWDSGVALQVQASDGNVGIATNAPATALEVVGDIRATQDGTNNCTLQYYTASNRWAMVQIINSTTNVTFVSP